MTGKVLVVVMSDTAAGSSVHVSEENVYWVQRVEIEVVPLVLCWISSAYHLTGNQFSSRKLYMCQLNCHEKAAKSYASILLCFTSLAT